MALDIPTSLVRHGRYDRETGLLTPQGRGDILRASNRLTELALGERMLIMSSDAPRAEESARLLALNLPAAQVVIDATLNKQGNRPSVEDFEGMLEGIAAEHDVVLDDHAQLIVVTHAPLINLAINHSLRRADENVQFGQPYPYVPGSWVSAGDLM